MENRDAEAIDRLGVFHARHLRYEGRRSYVVASPLARGVPRMADRNHAPGQHSNVAVGDVGTPHRWVARLFADNRVDFNTDLTPDELKEAIGVLFARLIDNREPVRAIDAPRPTPWELPTVAHLATSSTAAGITRFTVTLTDGRILTRTDGNANPWEELPAIPGTFRQQPAATLTVTPVTLDRVGRLETGRG